MILICIIQEFPSHTKQGIFRKLIKLCLQIKGSIGGEIIERIGNDCPTKSFKFVGVNIDENLSWNTHINKVKSKISFASLQISRLKNIFPTETLVNLYNGLFRPHIEFGLLA